MGRPAEDEAFPRRERALVLVRVDELVTLFGPQVAHAADRRIDSLAAVRRQLPELLKDLARPLLLIWRQVLPGLHAVEHVFLLLRWQAGKMLELVLQPGLLLRRKPPELRIVFERTALLRRRQIFITAKPVSGVSGLVLRTRRFIGAAGVRATLLLKLAPLPIRTLGLLTWLGLLVWLGLLTWLGLLARLLRRLWGQTLYLGERRRQQQKRCQTARNFYPPQHALLSSSVSANFQLAPRKRNFSVCRDGACLARRVSTGDSGSRILGYVVLHLQIVEHIEIGV